MVSQPFSSDRNDTGGRVSFFSSYGWCLHPFLPLEELFQRLREECARYETLPPGWQKSECRINLYLFVCAIACTLDDYLNWRPWRLPQGLPAVSRWKRLARIVVWGMNLPWTISGMIRRSRVHGWKKQWTLCVNLVCEMLVEDRDENTVALSAIRPCLQGASIQDLPRDLMRRRMKLHEGFRCQDLSHLDVFAMLRRFEANAGVHHTTKILIVGPRTAGAYFAPLAKAYLRANGWSSVEWVTIRPKSGLTRQEQRQLRQHAKEAHVLVMDDYPNTGGTFILTCRMLRGAGVPPERITLLAPRHPFQAGWVETVEEQTGAKVIPLEHDELAKHAFLQPEAVERFLREQYRGEGWDDISVGQHPETRALNDLFALQYGNSFQVRLKRVFDVMFRRGHTTLTRRIIAKSVGWGWLGYHAYHIAERLAGFVPPMIGFGQGFLYSEWVKAPGDAGRPGLLPPDGANRRLAGSAASYFAMRTQKLRLSEDPRIDGPDYGWGWLEMLALLRRAYGVRLGRVNQPVLLDRLRNSLHVPATVIDGRVGPEEWIDAAEGVLKADFEQHAFGAPELDVVDPAYDLAALAFEFDLPEDIEKEALEAYMRKSGDASVTDRLLLYKLLYGARVMKLGAEAAAEGECPERRQKGNRRYLGGRDFLIRTMNRFASGLIRTAGPPEWTRKVLFMDLDGVFDAEAFGFPHPTISGLKALSRLQSNGFSVVLNTGRSIEHVLRYCADYGLPGGIGEYGSVFVDSVARKTFPLTDAEGEQQLVRCREILRKRPGVFFDPAYRHAVRAYRYDGLQTAGLGAEEARELLAQGGLENLAVLSRQADTYFVQRGVDKGTALGFVRARLDVEHDPVAAIGDSDEDIPMLAGADYAYAPGNCSEALRREAKKNRWKVTGKPVQRGLLEAVEDMLPRRHDGDLRYDDVSAAHALVARLLDIAEKPRFTRLMTALRETLF
jgi:hydroxymethylpyrimidine pyrophosphatase-like HAD family hydrolase/orotate phosphoribosyltransferase